MIVVAANFVPREEPQNTSPSFAIATLAIYSLEMPAFAAYTVENHRSYADLHGYTHIVITEPPNPDPSKNHPGWQKVPMIADALESHDYVLSIDADALIMNYDISLVDLARQMGARDLAVSSDTVLVHSAQILYKSSPWTKDFLQTIWKFPELSFEGENAAYITYFCGGHHEQPKDELEHLLARCELWSGRHTLAGRNTIRKAKLAQEEGISGMPIDPDRWSHVLWLPQRSLNAYATALFYIYDFGEDDVQSDPGNLENFVPANGLAMCNWCEHDPLGGYNFLNYVQGWAVEHPTYVSASCPVGDHECYTDALSRDVTLAGHMCGGYDFGGDNATLYTPGDFIIHFPGIPEGCKYLLIQRFSGVRRRHPALIERR